MVGSVGMVRGLSRPNSLVIQEALNLLSALGGDSKGTTKKLLTEMKEIQDHNETSLASAKEEIANSNKRAAEVIEKEAELSRNVLEAEELYSNRLLDITNGEENLQHKVDEVNVWISGEDGRISELEEKLLHDREDHQQALRESNEVLTQKSGALKKERDYLKELAASIKSREENVKSDETGLDNIRNSLDERLTKLDMRDQRIRDAMKDEDID